MKAHPHSAGSRCSEVWSPAPPPSVRTGFGRSGTARTLRREAKWSSWPSVPARRGAFPLFLPCSTCRWLMLPQRASDPLAVTPLCPSGLLCVPTLPGNPLELERSPPGATVGPRRDVTTVEGVVEGRPTNPGLQCRSWHSVGCHFPAGGARDARVCWEDLVCTDPSYEAGFSRLQRRLQAGE